MSKRDAEGEQPRGAYDLETSQWINPICVGLAWGDIRTPDEEYIHISELKAGDSIAKATLRYMNAHPIKEWWAHNGARFDHLFLVDAALEMGWEVSALMGDTSKPARIAIKKDDKSKAIILKDSYQLVPSSLGHKEEPCKGCCACDFQLPSRKLFTADDYSIDPSKWPLDRLKAGCLIDCRLVLQLVDKVETLAEVWKGKLRSTFSSTALTSALEHASEAGCQYKQPPVQVNEVCRNAYYGGRCEPFHHSPGVAQVEYDLTSSYPWAATQALPWEYIGELDARQAQGVLEGADSGAIILAKVQVPPMHIPPLPWRHKEGGLYFPTGQWQAWFPANELIHAAKHGVHIEPLTGHAFAMREPFKAYIAEVFALKARSTGASRSFAKFLLNGSIGKFGQSPESAILRIFATAEEACHFIMRKPSGVVNRVGAELRVLSEKVKRWPKHTHYALASYILAYSRIRLHEGLTQVGAPSYCDTDGVHCAMGNPIAPLGSALGDWKVELDNYKAEFYAPKIYKLTEDNGKEHFASKGFHVDADTFARVIKGEVIHRDRQRLLKSQLKKGQGPQREHETRSWHGLSGKRRPLKDGRTVAWTVQDLLADKQFSHEALSPIWRGGS